MAEGGYFGYEDPELDNDIDNDDDDKEQEVNTTGQFQPGSAFQPGTASTPYHGGEQYEMQTLQHDRGLPDISYTEETPLVGSSAQSISEKHGMLLTDFFQKAQP